VSRSLRLLANYTESEEQCKVITAVSMHVQNYSLYHALCTLGSKVKMASILKRKKIRKVGRVQYAYRHLW